MQAITIDDALCKPHRPVRLYIRARPRMMTVRALKKMGSLDAKLPFGPAQKVEYNHSDLDGLSNHEKYRIFLTRMEMEVAGLMGIDGKELEAISGRAEGPKFVQRCALEEEVVGARRTSAVSRAWRRSAGWLSELLRTQNLVEVDVQKEGRRV